MTNTYEIELTGSPTEMEDFIRALVESENKAGARWVLVVDDEQSVRRMVGRSMKGLDKNLSVHEAENGQEALEVLAAIRKETGVDPALIVTDLQMPVMDGWEFIEQLRIQYHEQGREFGVPLIVLSSSSGQKGMFLGKSVHGEKSKYSPLVTIAKENCIKPMKYDAQGEQGLVAWIRHFLRKPTGLG